VLVYPHHRAFFLFSFRRQQSARSGTVPERTSETCEKSFVVDFSRGSVSWHSTAAQREWGRVRHQGKAAKGKPAFFITGRLAPSVAARRTLDPRG